MIATYMNKATKEAHGVCAKAVPSAVLTIKSTLANFNIAHGEIGMIWEELSLPNYGDIFPT